MNQKIPFHVQQAIRAGDKPLLQAYARRSAAKRQAKQKEAAETERRKKLAKKLRLAMQANKYRDASRGS